MASIEKRTNKDGLFSYRVAVRKNGCKPQYASFKNHENAILWAKQIEWALETRKLIAELSESFTYLPLGEEIIIKEEDFLNKYRNNGNMTEKQRKILENLNIKYIEPLSYEIAELLIKNHNLRKKYGFN